MHFLSRQVFLVIHAAFWTFRQSGKKVDQFERGKIEREEQRRWRHFRKARKGKEGWGLVVERNEESGHRRQDLRCQKISYCEQIVSYLGADVHFPMKRSGKRVRTNFEEHEVKE
jgi:hypothetical protein